MAFQFGAALAVFLAGGATPGTTAAVTPVEQQIVVPLIEPAALKAMLESKAELVVVDVRQPEEFAAGHIDGATLIPLNTLSANYTKLPKNVQLVVYCRSGKRSAKAVEFLIAHGYGKAVSLNGGYLAFRAGP